MKVKFQTDLKFDQHNLANSGVNQCFNECLVAIEHVGLDKYKVVELPPHSLTPQKSKRTFGSCDKAETYIESQYDKEMIVTVQIEDITEEIERRKVVLACEKENEQAFSDYIEEVVASNDKTA